MTNDKVACFSHFYTHFFYPIPKFPCFRRNQKTKVFLNISELYKNKDLGEENTFAKSSKRFVKKVMAANSALQNTFKFALPGFHGSDIGFTLTLGTLCSFVCNFCVSCIDHVSQDLEDQTII